MANRCFLLAFELGNGYRQIAFDPDFTSDWSLAEKGRTTVFFRATQYYGQALLRIKECYLPPPHGFWRHVYDLYRLAESHELLHEPVVHPGAGVPAVAVRDRFLSLMLFSLSPTNRHRPREVRQIYVLLNRFCAFAQLHKLRQRDGQTALFVIDLDADREPCRILQQHVEAGKGVRFLFTRELVDRMVGYYSEPVGMGEFGSGLSGGMIKRLVRSLGVPERRKSQRLAESGDRVVIVGLKHMIGALWRGRPLKDLPEGSTSIQYKGVKWLNVPDLQMEDRSDEPTRESERVARSEHAIGSMMSARKGFMSRDDIWGDRRFSGPGGIADLATLSAATINSSARGYCLLWTHRSVACLKVGELVGFPTGEGVLHAGVIRWLQQTTDGDVMLGVELLAPRTRAVSISASVRGGTLEMALLVPEDARLLREPSILVQPAKCNVGQALTVDDIAGLKNYRVERLVESSPSFQQFTLAEDKGLPVTVV